MEQKGLSWGDSEALQIMQVAAIWASARGLGGSSGQFHGKNGSGEFRRALFKLLLYVFYIQKFREIPEKCGSYSSRRHLLKKLKKRDQKHVTFFLKFQKWSRLSIGMYREGTIFDEQVPPGGPPGGAF